VVVVGTLEQPTQPGRILPELLLDLGQAPFFLVIEHR
jgi:hypothetical protein